MTRYTNATRDTIDILVKGEAKDGVPPTESLAPGETRNIGNVIDNAQLRGLLHSESLVEAALAARSATKD